MQKYYSNIATACATTEHKGREVELVGLIFPDDGVTEITKCNLGVHGAELKWMNIATAKNLIVSLQTAIDTCLEHQGGKR